MSRTVQEALRAGVARLNAARIDGAARDAQVLMAHVLGIGLERMVLVGPDPLLDAQRQAFEALIKRRSAHEPVSHLRGGRMFADRWFKVTSQVLDPRPETEELVAAARAVDYRSVLDLGCGSGAIIATLMADNPAAVGVGTDLSQSALDVALQNAQALGVADRLTLQFSDWYTDVNGKFDLIVSNPPYIALEEMDNLQPEVRDFEPRLALTDEGDGLSCYRAIAAGAGAHLISGGWIMLEIGPTQCVAVSAMLTDAGFADVGVRPDLDGRDRVVYAQKSA